MPYKRTKPTMMAPDLTPVTNTYSRGASTGQIATVTPRKLKRYPFRNRPKSVRHT